MLLKEKIKDKKNIIVIICMLIAAFSRIICLGDFPRGLSQDEAFSAYDAWSLANYGTDCFGYHFPVYNSTWGSGMSALYSWLSIPFIKIFGLNMVSIRLAQALLGVLSVYVLYKLMQLVSNEYVALITLFIFSINPWHIVLSRWGLDSATTPAFILLGMYFFIKGMEKEKYLLLSALAYGMSLYCYAFIWPILPVILLIQVIYGIYYKKLKLSKYSIFSVLILGMCAFPLFLFLAVNYGIIDEIKTAFISIPKISYFRSGELSSGSFISKLYVYYQVLFLQNDNNIWNQVPEFGLHYKFALVFAGVGLIYSLADALKKIKNKIYNPYIFMILQFFMLSIAAVIVDKCDTNKLNLLHIPMITFTAIGIYLLCMVIDKKLFFALFGIYIISFAMFEYTYFTDYQTEMAKEFNNGVIEATEYAMDITDEQICVSDKIYHSQLMFASKIPAPEYVSSVVYKNYPSIWLEVDTFGQFKFLDKEKVPEKLENKVYIWQKEDREYFENSGYKTVQFDNFIVAYVD